MPHLLHLDSSISGEASRSRAITRAFADAWTGTVTYRDLAAEPLPYLTDSAQHWTPSTDQQSIIDELLAADVVLVAAPLYNYTVPATLKTWLDYVHVPGVTFAGVQPLAGRTAVVVSTRGGAYDAETPTAGWDHGVPVLQIILGDALGMRVEVIQADRTLADTEPDASRAADDLAEALAAAAAASVRLG